MPDEYGHLYEQEERLIKAATRGTPPNYTVRGDWLPHGEKAAYEKTPSITIGWNPEDAPKMNRPALPESGVLPPLKRWG